MQVSVYSREAIECIIADGKFPENTAVISFYDPAIKRIDKDYSHVDYSGVCDTVFYSELDDLDLDVLKRKGYTYDTYFPEVDEMASFIVKAFMSQKDIICQCEYGQSRSAGCAAAILEYFYGNGISVFSNYTYYPNQVVFHKIYDALVKINPLYSFGLCSPEELYSQLSQTPHYKSDKFIDFSTGATTLFSKNIIDQKLTNLGICSHSFEEAFYLLRHGKSKVYVSLHIDDTTVGDGFQMGEHNIGVRKIYNISGKDIPLTISFPTLLNHTKNNEHGYYQETEQQSVAFFRRGTISLDVLGIMEMDSGRPIIDNSIITNITYTPSKNRIIKEAK